MYSQLKSYFKNGDEIVKKFLSIFGVLTKEQELPDCFNILGVVIGNNKEHTKEGKGKQGVDVGKQEVGTEALLSEEVDSSIPSFDFEHSKICG